MARVSLTAARVNAGLTTGEAAKKLGIGQKTLISYEKGRYSPNVKTVIKILDLYDMQFDDIDFLRTDEKNE